MVQWSLPLIAIFLASCVTANGQQGAAQKDGGAFSALSAIEAMDDSYTTLSSGVERKVSASTRQLPRRVAILPFVWAVDEKSPKGGGDPVQKAETARMLTQSFSNEFSSLTYISVAGPQVEETLVKLGLNPTRMVPQDKYPLIAEALNVDGLVIGRIPEFSDLYLVAFSQISGRLDVSMVSPKGKELWRIKHKITRNDGGVPTSVIGLLYNVVTAAMALDEREHLIAAFELMHEITEAIPVPKGGKKKGLRVMAALNSSGADPLRAGNVLWLLAATDSQAQVSARIGNTISLAMLPPEDADTCGEKTHKFLSQDMSGFGKDNFLWFGCYRVKSDVNIVSQETIISAFSDSGQEASYVDSLNPISIDTIKPGQPRGLKVHYLKDTMELSWNSVQDPGLRAYEIWRSGSPLSGFEKISDTEFTSFVDKKPLPKHGFYMIKARDAAGNLSDPMTSVEARVIPPGPTPVSGTLARDTNWFALSSPYVVDGTLNIPFGITLSIEPGTTIHVKPGGMILVKGSILAEGTDQAPISWQPNSTAGATGATGAADPTWQGLVLEKASKSQLLYNRIKGAQTALSIIDSDPNVFHSHFLQNGTGIRVSDFAQPVLQNNIIRANELGLDIVSADPLIEGNIIRFNRQGGIKMASAAPVISGNDLSDNAGPTLDISGQAASSLIMADKNWWGDVDEKNIQSRIKGAVVYTPYLDGPPPHGKPVMPVKTAAATAAQTAADKALKEKPLEPGQKAPPPTDEQYAAAAENLQEGYQMMEDGKFEEARPVFEKLVPLAGDNADFFNRLSMLRHQDGDVQGGIDALNKAITINPKVSQFYKSLAIMTMGAGDTAAAKAALEQALKINPADVTAKTLLSRITGS